MSSNIAIGLDNVWKKYSTVDMFHRSIRDDISYFFKRNTGKKLKEGEFWALRNINIAIHKGECIGLYGPNGSGKTTILKLIASITYPNIGKVTLKGRVAPLIEIGAGFHPDLTGKENIFMNGAIVGMSLKEIKDKMNEIIQFSELERFINMPVKKYSSGMYLRLGFSVAIHSSAEILLIDEILSVGDEAFQKKCIEKFKDIRRDKRTIIVVSHNKPMMERIVDRIIFLKNGEMVDLL
jgi:ABC-type polysaccharide/polyol phosphate transport system ATPase subunit